MPKYIAKSSIVRTIEIYDTDPECDDLAQATVKLCKGARHGTTEIHFYREDDPDLQAAIVRAEQELLAWAQQPYPEVDDGNRP